MDQLGHNLAQKIMYPYNLESVFRNLLKVSTVKRTRGYIVSFSEKTLVLGKWVTLDPILSISSKDAFFLILLIKVGHEV